MTVHVHWAEIYSLGLRGEREFVGFVGRLDFFLQGPDCCDQHLLQLFLLTYILLSHGTTMRNVGRTKIKMMS